MKSSFALVEYPLFLGAFNTHRVCLFTGDFSGSGVVPPASVCLFSKGSHILSQIGSPKEHLHFDDRQFFCPTSMRKKTECSQMMIQWDYDLSSVLNMVLAEKMIRVIVLDPRDQPNCKKLLLHRVYF